MVDWQSPQEIAHDGDAFSKFMHVLLGLYIWEFVNSLDFDWKFLSGKKTFRWPLIFYFANRYILLFALIGIAVALNVTKEVNCQGLYTFNQLFGNAAVGLSSINLSLRTMAVWSQRWFIVVPLVAIIIAHWSLLLHGVLLTATWVPSAGCVITSTDNKLLAVTFIYSMVFDLIVLCLTGVKLAFPASGRSKLVTLIFGDGLIFFIIAFLSNLLATIFMLANFNAVMSIIANVPAAVASTIVACRAVRRLTNYISPGPEIYATNTQASSIAFRSRKVTSDKKSVSGVHVQMETFASPSDRSFVQYDADGKVVKESVEIKSDREHADGKEYDIEAQVNGDDLKKESL